MKVQDLMSRSVRTIKPDASLAEAARMMRDVDIGALPVADDERMLGMLTDRDLVVRAIASGVEADAPVREVMSSEVLYCFDDQEIDEVCRNMAAQQIRRLPVVNRSKRLVGMLSLGDIAFNGETGRAGEALSHISNPGGKHSQNDARS
jgi:CBS domain-containing protein